MYSPFKLAGKYIHYFLNSSNGKGHGIHSPFVYDFVIHILRPEKQLHSNAEIENCRRKLLASTESINVEDFGAGSGILKSNQRSVKKIASSSLKPKKYAAVIQMIAAHYNCKRIIEIGTSFGITTSYLASGSPHTTVYTFEGSKSIANIAKQQFSMLNLNNIQLTEGNFDETLPGFLVGQSPFDLIYVDGNHKKDPTLRYFNLIYPYTNENSIFIFDDIHWSEEMEAAWEEIKADERVTLSIDLFFIGVIFLRKDFKVKQAFSIRY